MKTLLLLQLSLSLILAILGGEHAHNSESQHSAEAQMDFALKIYQSIAPLSEICPANLFISPVSIYTTLSMLALGARSTTRQEILQGMGPNDTETDEELHEGHKKLLQVLSHQSKDVKFHLGNEIFVDQSAKILQEYQHKVAHYYNASIQTVRFRDPQTAEKTINMLVSDKTDQRIENVAGNSKTSMVLLDYAVFEAKWKSEFKKEHTEMRPFMCGPMPVSVPMMYRAGVYKTYRDTEMNADVVKIPYAGNTDLLIIVPQLANLRRVEQELTPQRVKKYLHSVKSSVVELYLPKISFSSAVSLERALLHMDMAIIFDKNKADFSKISKTQNLSVSSIFHRSSTRLEEGGAEEAAATSTKIRLAISSPRFLVERPFLMLIYHKPTHAVLGIGRYTDPLDPGNEAEKC